MEIPNDTGGLWRLDKFAEYSSVVPSINPVTLGSYVLINNLNYDDCIYLAWLNSVTYSSETALFIFNELKWKDIINNVSEFWKINKNKLIFIPPKHYVKINNQFESLLKEFYKVTHGKPYQFIKSICNNSNEYTNFLNVQKQFEQIKYCSRFGVEEFMYCLIRFKEQGLLKLNISHPPKIDWKNGANVTTGLLNIFYHDEIADKIDCKNGFCLTDDHYNYLNSRLSLIKKRINQLYPFVNNDISLFQSKICSFRNLFKGRRYAGFHHDRQLENIYKYQKEYPENKLWDELFVLRKHTFQHQLLGELNDWDGVRKELKKCFLKEGKTMAEGIPELRLRKRV